MTTKPCIYALFIKDVLLLKDFGISLPFLLDIYVFAWIPICIRHGSSCLKLVVYSFVGYIYIYIYIYIYWKLFNYSRYLDKIVSILINIIQHEQYFFLFQTHVSAVISCSSLMSHHQVNNKCNRVKARHWRWLIYALSNFLLL